MRNAADFHRLYVSGFVLLVSLLSGAIHAATEIQPNRRYSGPVELTASDAGVQITVPAGWVALWPSNSEVLIIGSQQYQGFLSVGADEMDAAEVDAMLRGPIPLGDGIVLHPSGAPKKKGNEHSAEFTVTGAAPGTLASGRVIRSKSGIATYYVAMYPPGEKADINTLLDSVSGSVHFSKPKPQTAISASSSTATGGRHPGVSGQKIQRFYSGSGYSESSYIWLCSNGVFYTEMNGGGSGWNASGAAQSRNAGTWSTPGGRQLLLQYGNGSRSTYNMQINGTKLLLDGNRWFREPTNCQ